MIRWIFTFVLLPFFSFSLTRGCNLFSSNFSSISIALHRRGEFFLWCLLCGGFFYSQLSLYRPRQAKCCLLLLTAAALLPYTPEHLPVCAILHTLLALAAALLFLYNLFYLSLQFYLSSPAPARYSQTNSHIAFFSKLTHPLDSPAARGRLCLLLLWISCVFCLDSWILSGIINSAMEICLTLTAGVLFWLFFLIGKMVLCSDYKYSKPIEHYAIFTAYFYLSFRFIHCFVAGRSTGNSMLRLKILFGFPRYSDCR